MVISARRWQTFGSEVDFESRLEVALGGQIGRRLVGAESGIGIGEVYLSWLQSLASSARWRLEPEL